MSGSYDIAGEEYEAKLTIEKSDEAYNLVWEYPDIEEPAYGYGVAVGGYLGFGDEGAEGIIGIYKKQDSDITGVWTSIEGDVIMHEHSPDAGIIYPSLDDISGIYNVKGANSEGKNSYKEKMTIEEYDNTWTVSKEYEDGLIAVGIGLRVDNYLVTAFPAGDFKQITLYEIYGDKLEGKWVYRYVNDNDEEITVTGWEKAGKK